MMTTTMCQSTDGLKQVSAAGIWMENVVHMIFLLIYSSYSYTERFVENPAFSDPLVHCLRSKTLWCIEYKVNQLPTLNGLDKI